MYPGKPNQTGKSKKQNHLGVFPAGTIQIGKIADLII